MSRIGSQPITIPENITVIIGAGLITVKSKDNQLQQSLHPDIKVSQKDNILLVEVARTSRQSKALHGLTRSLIANMIIGLVEGFSKTLEIQGTGYRVTPKDKGIELTLGFSHPVVFEPPQGVKLEIKDTKYIVVTGADKYLVGQTAANIRHFRSPDAYKGKGIRYQDEVVRLKPGKAAKAAGE
ncbi:MAG: 50S ribosomal protein L6 [Patescibacteria group bacterium]|nr:50S ribosomal protein L6 [Patescibacteria group bacterium]